MSIFTVKTVEKKLLISHIIEKQFLVCGLNSKTLDDLQIPKYSLLKITFDKKIVYAQLRENSALNYLEISLSLDLRMNLNIDDDQPVNLEVLDANQAIEATDSILIVTNEDKRKFPSQIFWQNFSYKPLFKGYSFEKNNKKYTVINANLKAGSELFFILNDTKIQILTEKQFKDRKTLFQLKGNNEVILKLNALIYNPLKYNQYYEVLGMKNSNGILLVGPQGIGKTSLITTYLEEYALPNIYIDCNTLVNKYVGEAEETIRKLFLKLQEKKPSALVLDNFETIAKMASPGSMDYDKKIVNQICSSMSKISSEKDIFVIAIADSSVELTSEVRGNNIFGEEIFMKPPSITERKEILDYLVSKVKYDSSINLDQISEKCVGYVPADLEKLVQTSGRKAVTNFVKKGDDNINNLVITEDEINDSFKEIFPNCLKEFSFERTNVRWHNIVGHDKIINTIKERFIIPRKYSHIYEDVGLKGVRGLLLYGPPGTGKTLLAKAIANEFNFNFISVSGPELKKTYYGESEQKLRKIFTQASLTSPTIIFFDEMDSLFRDRGAKNGEGVAGSLTGQLLTLIDGIKEVKDVIVVGTTNRKEDLDAAILRAGRIDLHLEIDYPNTTAVKQLFSYYTKNLVLDGVTIEKLVSVFSTNNRLTGASIHSICSQLLERSIILNNPKVIDNKVVNEVLKLKQENNSEGIYGS